MVYATVLLPCFTGRRSTWHFMQGGSLGISLNGGGGLALGFSWCSKDESRRCFASHWSGCSEGKTFVEWAFVVALPSYSRFI